MLKVHALQGTGSASGYIKRAHINGVVERHLDFRSHSFYLQLRMDIDELPLANDLLPEEPIDLHSYFLDISIAI